jgi:hypothetical protein
MPSLEEKFDRLHEDLLGKEPIHPGILVRMDARLATLEENPIIKAGRHLKFMATVILSIGAVAFAIANMQTVFAMVGEALHRK